MAIAALLQQVWEDRRRDRRARVLLPAQLKIHSVCRPVLLLNLSRTGAMMDAAFPPPPEAKVTLICDDVAAEGSVIWVEGYRFGLAFDAKLDARQVATIADRSQQPDG